MCSAPTWLPASTPPSVQTVQQLRSQTAQQQQLAHQAAAGQPHLHPPPHLLPLQHQVQVQELVVVVVVVVLVVVVLAAAQCRPCFRRHLWQGGRRLLVLPVVGCRLWGPGQALGCPHSVGQCSTHQAHPARQEQQQQEEEENYG